jgi:phosphopantothenate-cysteine ligase
MCRNPTLIIVSNFQLVIGNILQSRKQRVVFVTQTDQMDVILTDKELADDIEIETKIIDEVIRRHEQYIKN